MHGVNYILPTPFHVGGDIDEASLRRLVRSAIDRGAVGLTCLAVNGESHKMSDEERFRVASITLEAAGSDVPVWAGASRQSTEEAVRFSKELPAMGMAGLMIAPPQGMDDDQLVMHYRTLADETGLPIILQDYPDHSGVLLSVQLLVRILREVDTVVAIKQEDPPTPFKTAALRAALSGGSPSLERDVAVVGGLNGIYLVDELKSGAVGAMTGFPFPEVLAEIIRLMAAGDEASERRAREVYQAYLPIMLLCAQRGIGLSYVKEILRRRGWIDSGAIRQPGVPLDQHGLKTVETWLAFVQSGL